MTTESITQTAVYEGANAIYLGCAARILDVGDKELAWAEDHIETNEYLRWILGRYIESDKANSNRQHFSMENMRFGQPSLTHAPLNVNHGDLIVGAYVASEIVYPTQAPTAGEEDLNPYMEALSVFWKHYFEDEYTIIETAHKAGRLFYSMECMPSEIACAGPGGCGNKYEYAGRKSDTYCPHLNNPHDSGVFKDLINPHFTAGALIVPPTKPGWGRADIKQISQIVRDHAEAAEALYEAIGEELPNEDAEFWEQVMTYIMLRGENLK